MIVDRLAAPEVLKNYCYLLENYYVNEPSVNMRIITALERLAEYNSGEHITLFFQMTLLSVFLKIKADRYIQPRYL